VKAVTSPAVVPDIEIFKYQDKDIVMLWVPSYPVKPVSMKGKYFIREKCIQSKE
jgi:ATP-dependent DNA helicase RecG